MRRDPTEFRERFAAWKAGEKVYENGLPTYGGGKSTKKGSYYLPGEKPRRESDVSYDDSSYDSKRRYDYKYVQAGKDNGWVRITDDKMSDVFQDFVARPKSRGGNTDTYNWNKQWALKGEPGLETVSPEFELLSFSPALKAATKYVIKKGADKAGLFIHHPNSFTRGIGDEAGLQDLIESQLVRGNPVGTEMSAKGFGKAYRFNRNHFREIMDGTGRDGIAQRYYNRSLNKEDFESIKNSAQSYMEEWKSSPKPTSERFQIALGRQNPDPLSEYPTWEAYQKALQEDRLSLRNATSVDDSGQPLAYFYDDGRNPIASGYDYASSKYGVRINNASEYEPRIFPGHLHYSMPKAVSLSDPNVELFRRGPFGITIRMKKPVR